MRTNPTGYPTVRAKEEAVVGLVADAHATGRPVLIGTLDVAESERLAGELDRAGLRCTVLNAKNDAQEAAIVAEAGARGAITVSTQMAGRGTDIRLGGTGIDRALRSAARRVRKLVVLGRTEAWFTDRRGYWFWNACCASG